MKNLLIALSVILLAACNLSTKANAKITDGVDYNSLPMLHRVANPHKIEVLEFFWFTCPHCYKLEPNLIDFTNKQPADVSVLRIHVVWGKDTVPLAKLAATMADTNTEAKLHLATYQAFFEKHLDLSNPKILESWLKTQKGIDVAKFMATYNSFSINTIVARYAKMTKEYSVDGTPMIIVDGRYQVAIAEPKKMLQVTNELIAKVRHDNKTNSITHKTR